MRAWNVMARRLGAAILAGLLSAGGALAQAPPVAGPMRPGNNLSEIAQGGNAATLEARRNLGVQGSPKTNLFTFAPTGGVGMIQTPYTGSTPVTTLNIVPFEAPPHAVRVGFCNPFNVAMTIASASVYPSSNYSNAATVDANAANVTVVPGGGGSGNPLYFAFRGADDPRVNDGSYGTTRAFTLPGDATNTGNVARPCAIQWTDWGPFSPVARDDGGVQPLGFIYVTVGGSGGTHTYGALNMNGVFSGAAYNRGRKILCAISWNKGIDYADNPTGTGWAQGPGAGQRCPYVAVQYLTMARGTQIVVTGDSLSNGPTEDGISSSVWRAAMDLSTPAAPISVASLAWGSANFSVFGETARWNLRAIRPGIFITQALSRTEGGSLQAADTFLGKNETLAAYAFATFGTRHIISQMGGEPSYTGDSAAIAAFNNVLARVRALSTVPETPFIDCLAAIAQPASPWLYLPGMSNDNTHPNAVAAEACVGTGSDGLAKAALKKMLN